MANHPQNVKKKILTQYYEDVKEGIKTFELRKDEDDIQPGDILDLIEWSDDKSTGRNVRCAVTYVLRNCPEYGLKNGYCIIGIDAIGEIVAVERSPLTTNTPIPELISNGKLSTRTGNALCREGITTTLALTYIEKEQLLKVRGIGENSCDEILKFCEDNHINIGSNADVIPTYSVGDKVRSLIDAFTPRDNTVIFKGTELTVVKKARDGLWASLYECETSDNRRRCFSIGEIALV